MPQHTDDLPIACVEGWTTTQTLDRRAAAPTSPRSPACRTRRRARRVAAAARRVPPGDARPRTSCTTTRSLLALQVNGDDLPLDHGYPARIIVPALPGVHCTKWVEELHFT